jgi:F-type H+-transporting ATPase subunit delta
LISFTLAKKYARALLEIGQQAGNFEALGSQLQQIGDLLKRNKELKTTLGSAAYPAVQRQAIARAIGQALGVSQETIDFIELLIERERMDHFPEIVKAYEALCDTSCNRHRASLVSAMRLSPKLVEEVTNQLKSSTGKEVIISVQEDSSLIGGALAKIGNVVYDGSLKTQLLRVKRNLQKE